MFIPNTFAADAIMGFDLWDNLFLGLLGQLMLMRETICSKDNGTPESTVLRKISVAPVPASNASTEACIANAAGPPYGSWVRIGACKTVQTQPLLPCGCSRDHH